MTLWCMSNNTDMSLKHYINVLKNIHVVIMFELRLNVIS